MKMNQTGSLNIVKCLKSILLSLRLAACHMFQPVVDSITTSYPDSLSYVGLILCSKAEDLTHIGFFKIPMEIFSKMINKSNRKGVNGASKKNQVWLESTK